MLTVADAKFKARESQSNLETPNGLPRKYTSYSCTGRETGLYSLNSIWSPLFLHNTFHLKKQWYVSKTKKQKCRPKTV